MNSNQTVKGIKHIYNNDVKIARIIDTAGTLISSQLLAASPLLALEIRRI